MTDLALIWSPDRYGADLGLSNGALATDDGLVTAVIVSLFTDARAAVDDPLPEAGGDRRGWWGDALSAVQGDVIGSRLWLISREKQLPSVLARAERYASEALQWLIDDRVASQVIVSASFPRDGWIALAVAIDRPTGPARERFDLAWSATELSVS